MIKEKMYKKEKHMNPENIQLMNLLTSHILEQDNVRIIPNVDWHRLVSIAERQNILEMIGDKLLGIKEQALFTSEESQNLYMRIMKRIYLTSKKFERAINMLELMHQNGIRVIVLKGCAVRDLYPVPEWRTMGDIDILIAPCDMKKAKALFEEHGYEVKGTPKREFDCYKDKNIPWEIKCTLEAEFKDSYVKWDKMYFDSVQPWKYSQYMPLSTLLFQHIIIHTAGNLSTVGAGVRNLCDIALCMMKLTDIDYSSVKQTCEEEGYIKVYNALMNCVRYWFDIDISHTGAELLPNEAVENITEYMLSETIYGKRNADNRLINWTLRRDESISPWRKVFFPSIKLLKMPYPYLKKYPFLLPAAWIQRGYDAVFKQKIPVSQMIKGAKESVDYAKEHEEYMKKLGLK